MKNLDPNKPQPLKTDPEAPEILEIVIRDKKTGETFLTDLLPQKHFSTGSVGYFFGGKMTNPQSGERYQVSCNIALIGSKPDSK
jgi:hypothetical protein